MASVNIGGKVYTLTTTKNPSYPAIAIINNGITYYLEMRNTTQRPAVAVQSGSTVYRGYTYL
jgi:hypothetical protein